jgi:uroporphyrinogen III methyltransferase/synthase
VVELRSALGWFENRPLFGKSILVTRPRHQAESLVRELEILGATVHTSPLLEIGPAPDPAAVIQAIHRLKEFDWLVFTSVNGVSSFFNQLFQAGRDMRELGSLKLAAIGPSTAAALQGFHLRADLVPKEYRSESLVAELRPHVEGKKILLARADRGRELLFDALAKIADVEQIAVYSQCDVRELDPEVRALLQTGKMDFVTLTSSNGARAFARLLDDEMRQRIGRDIELVTISPVTSAAVRELGLPVAAEATVFTTQGLIQALVERSRHLISRTVSQEM